MQPSSITKEPHVGRGSCRIGPVPFPGGRSYEATKPGFSFYGRPM